MTTSEPLQLSLEVTTSSLGDSLVSPTRKRGSAKRPKMTAIYGQNCTESFARFSPDGVCLRTLSGYLVANLDGSLEEFSGTWPRQGLMQSGQLFQRQIWEPVTTEKESGSSLIPTPNASEALCGGSRTAKRGQKRTSGHNVQFKFRDWCVQTFGSNHPIFYEQAMGYPVGWTDIENTELGDSETP